MTQALTYYVSRTGNRRNLAAMRAAGFRVLVSRAHEWRTEGFAYCLDSGGWADHQAGRPFDDDGYERMIDRLGAGADFIVLPDRVGERSSLDLSVRWLNRTLATGAPLVLIPVQNGMQPADLEPLVGPNVGIFLGGDTAWKLGTMQLWGEACADWGVHYHVARINTRRRIFGALGAGATSGDGSSAARYAVTVPLLVGALAHIDLFCPRRTVAA
jgi:hypothetical protein